MIEKALFLKCLTKTILILQLITASIVSADTVSVNFAGSLSPTGVMGASNYAADNWLNTINQSSSWGTTYNLEDQNGTVCGAVLSVWASGFGAMMTFVTDTFPVDSQMMETGIGGWLTDAASFTVNSIPYSQYTAIIYFSSAESFGYVQKINVNNQSPIYAKYARYSLQGYVLATATEDNEIDTPSGNYAVFEGLTDSTLTVSVDAGWTSQEPDGRAYISGFQIVEYIDPCADGNKMLGDLDGDCVVDVADLNILMKNWLAAGQ